MVLALLRKIDLPPSMVGATCNSDPRTHYEDFTIEEGWARSRRREFLRGRAAARQALQKLGVQAGSIPMEPNGAPRWPAGIAGSIAHKRGIAIAAVGRRSAVTSIGVDLDLDDRRDATHADDWGSRNELNDASRCGVQSPASMLFAVKEAVYKCVSPALGVKELGFHDVVVTFLDERRFIASLPTLNTSSEGLAWRRGPWLVAVAWL